MSDGCFKRLVPYQEDLADFHIKAAAAKSTVDPGKVSQVVQKWDATTGICQCATACNYYKEICSNNGINSASDSSNSEDSSDGNATSRGYNDQNSSSNLSAAQTTLVIIGTITSIAAVGVGVLFLVGAI